MDQLPSRLARFFFASVDWDSVLSVLPWPNSGLGSVIPLGSVTTALSLSLRLDCVYSGSWSINSWYVHCITLRPLSRRIISSAYGSRDPKTFYINSLTLRGPYDIPTSMCRKDHGCTCPSKDPIVPK